MKKILFSLSLFLAACTSQEESGISQSKNPVYFSVESQDLEAYIGPFEMPEKQASIHPNAPDFESRIKASDETFDRGMAAFHQLIPLLESQKSSPEVAQEIEKQLTKKNLSTNAHFLAQLHLSTHFLIRLLNEKNTGTHRTLIEKNLAFLAYEAKSGNTILAYRALEVLQGYSKTSFLREIAKKFNQNLSEQRQSKAESLANNPDTLTQFEEDMQQQDKILQDTRLSYYQKIEDWLAHQTAD